MSQEKPHCWIRCPMCGPVVICGKCGMNQCSGGSGCDACESAYQKQCSNDGLPLWGRALDAWMLLCAYARMLRPHYIGWMIWKWRGMPEPRPWWTFIR